VIQAILASAGRALEGASRSLERVSAIGCRGAGLADGNRHSFHLPQSPWVERHPPAGHPSGKFKKKAFLINDGNAAALGEYYFGAAKGTSHFHLCHHQHGHRWRGSWSLERS